MNLTFEQATCLFRHQIRKFSPVSHQSLNQKAAGRGENGDFRVPEHNVLEQYVSTGTQKIAICRPAWRLLEQALNIRNFLEISFPAVR